MRNRLIALSTAAAVIAAASCGSDSSSPPVSNIVNFDVNMNPAGEVGATLAGNPQGTGEFKASLDTVTNVFTWNFTFAGMTSNVRLGHIHGPYVLGGGTNSAGVVLNFDPAAAPAAATNVKFDGLNAAANGSGSGTIVLSGATIIGNGVSADSLKRLLLAGHVYANIHTVTNGGGEIRAQIVPK
jgi:hypothetical protein